MMRAYVIGSFVLVSALILAQPVFAIGGDYQINLDGNIVTEQPDWPAGLAELINSGPVFGGYWVDAESAFFFLGDTASLTRFLKRYSTLENTPLLVVIHAGSERRNEPWVDKPKKEYDWKVRLQKRGWGAPVKPDNPEEQWVVTVEVWIDRNIRLAELVCPKDVEVRSGGEIDRFILRPTEALIMGAGQIFGAVKERKDRADVPSEYWAEPIKALNPIKVYLHDANVVVVQRNENGTEEGKYIATLLSSSIPHSGEDGFVFTPGPATHVLDFKRATYAQIPDSDQLIEAIHGDLMQLRATTPWLKSYNERNLKTRQECKQGRAIAYYPPVEHALISPQAPDQMALRWLPLSHDNSHDEGGSNGDHFFRMPECRFPEFDSRLSGALVINGEGSDEARKAIEAIVAARCAAWHKKLAK